MRVIAGRARHLPLASIPGTDTRPTSDIVKETLFNMINPYLPDCRFLDIFAGCGGIGIEAVSRGAASCTFIESSHRAASCIRRNLEFTRLAQESELIEGDALSALARLGRRGSSYDIIFMDPPYEKEWEKKVLTLLADSPLAAKDTLIIVEAEKHTDLSYAEDLGFSIMREKIYKNNKHIFLKRSAGKEEV